MIEQKPFQMDQGSEQEEPVECLGMTFPNDEARRDYFLGKLREKLQDPEFRKIEGFPIGTDEDILALSDPPYYTACPNPFIADFIACYGKPYNPDEPYHKEPFAADVSEGKSDPIYLAHSYHTKVPHKAIMRYILHYTRPGDIVFDGFCGTGMTGVAARLCGAPDKEFRGQIEKEWLDLGWERPEWGVRRALLADLSPGATFISYNYNVPLDAATFEREAGNLFREVDEQYGWMYRTAHTDTVEGRINYIVWSDVFLCSECGSEVVFWDSALNLEAGELKDAFPCPQCNNLLTKRNMERAWVTKFDKAINKTVRQAKQVPVLINYSVGNKRFEKKPDPRDIALIERIDDTNIPYSFPVDIVPHGFNTEQPRISHGITHIHHFYTKSALAWLACMFDRPRADRRGAWAAYSMVNTISTLYRYVPKKPGYQGQGGGVL